MDGRGQAPVHKQQTQSWTDGLGAGTCLHTTVTGAGTCLRTTDSNGWMVWGQAPVHTQQTQAPVHTQQT